MKNLKKIINLGLVIAMAATVLFLNSCKEDDEAKPGTSTPASYSGVFVINEGGFLKGNSSVDFYNPASGELSDDLFAKKNSRPLGDILQSMTKVGNKFYLIVNNSQKIEVVNAETFASTATINNMGSPRFLLPLSSSGNKKAYVTDLFNGVIHIVDLDAATKTGSITLPGWSENMVEVGTDVYVNNWSNKKVYEINSTNNTIADSIVLTGSPNGLVKDKNGKLWVLVDSIGATQARFMRINPADNSIEATVLFPAGQSASKLAINGSGDKLYYTTSTGVYEMDITANALPATAKKAGYFYGLGVDPKDGSVYVTDALDFNQKGIVYRLKADGSESNFKVGIVPGGFFFNY